MVSSNSNKTEYNWVVESPIFPKQPGCFYCSIEKFTTARFVNPMMGLVQSLLQIGSSAVGCPPNM